MVFGHGKGGPPLPGRTAIWSRPYEYCSARRIYLLGSGDGVAGGIVVGITGLDDKGFPGFMNGCQTTHCARGADLDSYRGVSARASGAMQKDSVC